MANDKDGKSDSKDKSAKDKKVTEEEASSDDGSRYQVNEVSKSGETDN